MKKLLLLLMFVSSLSFGQIIVKQANKVNNLNTVFMGSGGTSATDTANSVMVVQKQGNVGIGTTTPTYKLHAAGSYMLKHTFAGNQEFYLSADDIIGGVELGAKFQGSSFPDRFFASIGEVYMISTDSAGGSNHVKFTLSGPNHYAYLQNANLGIGTNTPTRKLQVNGSAQIDSTLILTGIYFTDTDSTFTIPSGLATALSWKAGGGAWVSGTVTLPANPVNGQIVSVSGDWTSVSLAASGGATIVYTPTATQFRHGTKFIYRAADTSWYPR